MFAYCGNNPVNYFDKTGRAPDSLAGWAGAAIGEWLYELFTGRTHPNKQAREIETQIIQKQNEIVADTSKALWDAHTRGMNMQQEAQLQNSQALIDGAEYFVNHPKKAETLLRDMVVTSVSVTKLISATIVGGPIGVLVATAVVALWDLTWTIYEVIGDFR